MGNTRQEREKIRQHEYDITKCILDDLKPDVAVPCGVGAMRALARVLNVPEMDKIRMGTAVGNIYCAKLRCGEVMRICPSRHLSWPPRYPEWDPKTANAILKALEHR